MENTMVMEDALTGRIRHTVEWVNSLDNAALLAAMAAELPQVEAIWEKNEPLTDVGTTLPLARWAIMKYIAYRRGLKPPRSPFDPACSIEAMFAERH